MDIHGKLVDIHKRSIFPATVTIEKGRIVSIQRNTHRGDAFILPGLIDPHISIESSLLPPTEFARIAVRHGTVATVSDPHKMGAVLGISGVEFLLENGTKTPFKFHFGAPSRIPVTDKETAGGNLGLKEVKELLANPLIFFLSVISPKDPELPEKIAFCQRMAKHIDGASPSLFGEELKKYVALGIETDASCATLSEAREKRALGLKILIQEGSASKNLNALFPLLSEDPTNCMLCTGHLHPDHLQLGHLNLLLKRVVEMGMDPIDAITCVTKTPVDHYDLDVGLLREGDPADLLLVENLESFRVLETYIDGNLVFKQEALLPRIEVAPFNNFHCSPKKVSDFSLPAKEGDLQVIEVFDGTVLTKALSLPPCVVHGECVSDLSRDLLKIANVCRYRDQKPTLGFVKNFGLKKGAIASSLSHDAQNIVAVGVKDADLANAVNAIIEAKGGMAISCNGQTDLLPLPIGGILSILDGEELAVRYSDLEIAAKALGATLKSPFVTLSFMSQLP